MKNKKKIALGAGVLAAAMVIGGTFAWFSTTDSKQNQFGLDNFDVAISEDFDTPDVPVVPGANITKNVQIENNGNVDVYVRVKLEETLHLLEQDTANGVDKVKLVWMDAIQSGEQYVPAKVSTKMYEAKKVQFSEQISGATLTPADNQVEIWQKTTTTGDNTVYSYFAVKKIAEGDYQLVKATPTAWTGDNKATPSAFTIEYGYNTWKGDGKAVTAIHDMEDNRLDTYLGGGADSFHKAVSLIFGDSVQTDKGAYDSKSAWYLANDGYFYYMKPLTGGAITEPLLQSVQFTEAAGNALRGAQYTLTPVMEAYQEGNKPVDGRWPSTAA